MAQVLTLSANLPGSNETTTITTSDDYILNINASILAAGSTFNINVTGVGTHANFTGVNANLQLLTTTNYNVGEGATLEFSNLAGVTLSALSTVNFNIADNGTLILSDFLAVDALGTRNINFTGEGAGRLEFSSTLNLNLLSTTKISGFGYGKQIDIGSSADGLAYNATTGVLTLYQGAAQVGTLNLDPNLDQSLFRLDPWGTGTSISYACFLRGTMISTPEGDVVVEQLRVGDEVMTLSGARKVRWIGSRLMRQKDIPEGDEIRVQPVRIRADAFSPGVPKRDLLVSPGHCMFIDGALIPAMSLVNGTTIVQEWEMDAFEFYHVELDVYDMILAEGTASESYVDKGNRHMFVTPGVLTMLPNFGRGTRGALEKIRSVRGPVVEAARSKLFDRAIELGYQVTRNPDLSFTIGGVKVPHSVGKDGKTYTLELSGWTGDLVISSRSAVVREFVTSASRDLRRVGVAVTGLTLHRGDGAEAVPLDHDALGEGFHDVQTFRGLTSRWTNGQAVLRASFLSGVQRLDLRIASTPRYWSEDAATLSLMQVA